MIAWLLLTLILAAILLVVATGLTLISSWIMRLLITAIVGDLRTHGQMHALPVITKIAFLLRPRVWFHPASTYI